MLIITEIFVTVNEEVSALLTGKRMFDQVNWEKLLEILKDIGLDCKERKLIKIAERPTMWK